MKKIIALTLICLLGLLDFTPIIASEIANTNSNGNGVIETKTKIKLEFAQDFNANKADVGDEITFRLKEEIRGNNEDILPVGTKFVAIVTQKDKSKFGYRRAVAHLKFNRIVLPNGHEYLILANTNKDLKSPEILNLAKGITSTATCVGVCLVGATVIAVEALSVVGLVFLPYAGIAVGGVFAATGKGLNYKAHAGTSLTIILKEPISLDLQKFDDMQSNTQFTDSNNLKVPNVYEKLY